jgi:hypothetical protein
LTDPEAEFRNAILAYERTAKLARKAFLAAVAAHRAKDMEGWEAHKRERLLIVADMKRAAKVVAVAYCQMHPDNMPSLVWVGPVLYVMALDGDFTRIDTEGPGTLRLEAVAAETEAELPSKDAPAGWTDEQKARSDAALAELARLTQELGDEFDTEDDASPTDPTNELEGI